MELELQRTNDVQGEVLCDGQRSHTFSLVLLQQHSHVGPPPDPIAYGETLYQALFPPASLALRTLNAESERLLLVCADETLDAIAWEYLSGPAGPLVLALSFVRGLSVERRIAPPSMAGVPLHLVAVPSHPLDPAVKPLNIDAEWQRLEQIIRKLPHACTLERTRPPTVEQVRALVANKPQRVIHFMGHGQRGPEGERLWFERENGALDAVTAQHFVQRVRGSAFLVTLNACVSAAPGPTAFSNLAAALVQHRIPYALGMRFRIADEDALAFARTFYGELAQGTSVEEALRQARLTLASSALQEAVGIPVLYTALSASAAGFHTLAGAPHIDDHQPPLEVSALPRAVGTFQGRHDELKEIGTLLTGNARPPVLTIHGPGGQGKTALAREIAERYAFAWPGGVYALTLENLPTRPTFAADLARLLGIDTHTITDPAEIERLIQRQLSHARTLLILDNAETLTDAVKARDASALDLATYLRQLSGPTASLLVTSRAHLQWPGEVSIELEGLSDQEGAALFSLCAPQRVRDIDFELADQLSRKLEGHPLSLRLLGAAFNSTKASLSIFLQECYARLAEAEDIYATLTHRHRTLYACLDTSTRHLSPELRALLSGLWVFHAPFLPETAVAIFDPTCEETEAHPSPVRDQLHTLWQRGLLSYDVYDDQGVAFYHLLPVMRRYVKERLEQVIEEAVLLTRFGEAYASLASSLYRRLDKEGAASLIAVQANDDLERGLDLLDGDERGEYLRAWGWVLHRTGYARRGVVHLEAALEALQTAKKRSRAAVAIGTLALLYKQIGRVQEAERLYEQSLLIRREVGDRAGEAATLNNLAGLYRATGRVQEAERLYAQVLPISREVGDRAGEAATLNNLAGLYEATGRVQEAERLYAQVLPIRREVGDRAGEAVTLNNLAGLYEATGRVQEAERLYAQALPIRREVGDRAGEAVTLNNLAGLYEVTGRVQEAERLYAQALPIRREVGDRAGEAATLSNLAWLLYEHFDTFEEAIVHMERGLTVLRETGLPQDAAGQTVEVLQARVQRMHAGLPLARHDTLSAEAVQKMIESTVAVMTLEQDQQAKWREYITDQLEYARQQGEKWLIEIDFYHALLALLNGHLPALPPAHPYARVIERIRAKIALYKGGK